MSGTPSAKPTKGTPAAAAAPTDPRTGVGRPLTNAAASTTTSAAAPASHSCGVVTSGNGPTWAPAAFRVIRSAPKPLRPNGAPATTTSTSGTAWTSGPSPRTRTSSTTSALARHGAESDAAPSHGSCCLLCCCTSAPPSPSALATGTPARCRPATKLPCGVRPATSLV